MFSPGTDKACLKVIAGNGCGTREAPKAASEKAPALFPIGIFP
jgi:hypothetical protein